MPRKNKVAYRELSESQKEGYRRASRKQKADRFAAGLCVQCGKVPPITKYHCAACVARWAERQKIRNAKLKDAVFAAYGGAKCNCCGIAIKGFLTMDHIEGRNACGHDKSITGPVLYRWLKKNNFPPGFQVLCFNCNCGKSTNGGICPHAQERIVAAEALINNPTESVTAVAAFIN